MKNNPFRCTEGVWCFKIALKRSDDDWRVVFSSKFHFIGSGQKTLINR